MSDWVHHASEILDRLIIKIGTSVAAVTGGVGLLKGADWMVFLSALVGVLTVVKLLVGIYVDVAKHRRAELNVRAGGGAVGRGRRIDD